MSTFPDSMDWYVLPLNPEPWAVGPLSVGRRHGKPFPQMGRNQQLHNYKEAVREALKRQRAEMVEWKHGDVDGYELVFLFNQVLESYQAASGRTVHDKEADLTNLVKATEDAIQGVLIHNDKMVRKQTNYVERSVVGSVPYVVIGVAPYIGIDPNEFPAEVWEGVDLAVAEHRTDNTITVLLPEQDVF